SGDAAAELGAGEADHIAQYPEQRHIVRYVLGVRGTVDAHSGHTTLSRVGEGSSPAKLPQAPASRGQRGAYIIMQSHDAVRVAARKRRCSGIVRWRGATCGIPSAIKMGMTRMMNWSMPLASRKDAMVPAAPPGCAEPVRALRHMGRAELHHPESLEGNPSRRGESRNSAPAAAGRAWLPAHGGGRPRDSDGQRD